MRYLLALAAIAALLAGGSLAAWAGPEAAPSVGHIAVTQMELVLDRDDPSRSPPAGGVVDFGLQSDASRPFSADRQGNRLRQKLYLDHNARTRDVLDGSWPLSGRPSLP